MITKFSTCLLFLALLLNSCQQRNQPTSPQYEAEYNRSTTPALIDIEKALDHPAMLKLSQIASKLEYYNVGDARYTVTQAIAIPDSDAFITFNNPRIYYRKQGIPSKRYGFKALDYKWNHGMNGLNLFYPSSAEHHIQNTAPGPPMAIAPATPAMLPVPTVPASAVHTA